MKPNKATFRFFFLLLATPFIQTVNLSGQSLYYDQTFTMGGQFAQEGSDIAVDAQKNIYTVGTNNGTIDLDPGSGVQNASTNGFTDMFVQKLDSNGVLEWAHHFGGSVFESPEAIALDQNNNVLIAGYFSDTIDIDPGAGTHLLYSSGPRKAFILKLNSQGQFIWAKSYGNQTSTLAENIAIDGVGNIWVAGTFRGTVDFDPGNGTNNLSTVSGDEVFIQKLDGNGSFLWAGIFTGGGDEKIHGLTVDASNFVYLTGSFGRTVDFNPGSSSYNLSSQGGTDVYVVRLDNAGNLNWAHAFGDGQSDVGTSIVSDASHNIYITGRYDGTVDFDPSTSIANLTSSAQTAGFLVKLDSAANYTWAKSFDGPGSSSIRISDVTVSEGSNVWVSGDFNGAFDSDPGAANTTLTSLGCSDVFTTLLDTSGKYQFSHSYGGADCESLAGSFVQSDAFYTAGFFETSVDFNPASGLANFTSDDARDVFIQRFSRTCSPDSTIDSIVACDQYTWVNGMTYTSSDSGVVYQTTSGVGCDSVVTLDLTINESAYINDIFNRCNDYTWFVNGQTYDSSGTYTETFTSQEGCDSIHALQLTIDTLDTTVTVSGTQLTASSVPNQYQWLDCSNSFQTITGETNMVYSPTANGSYAVEVINGACKDTSECHTISSIPTNIKTSFEANNIQVFPNPASSKIFISGLDSDKSYTVRIITLSGQEVMEITPGNSNGILAFDNSLPAGLYLLQLNSEGISVITSQIAIE